MSEYTDFPFVIDWGKGVAVRYAFSSSIFQAYNTAEQRASLRSNPFRSISFSVTDHKDKIQEMVSSLLSLVDTQVIVPFYQEYFNCTGYIVSGDATVSADLKYLYNLRKANVVNFATSCFIIITDKYDKDWWIFTKIVSLSDTEIVLDLLGSSLTRPYVNLLFFPALVANLKTFRKTNDTDTLATITAEFAEKETWEDYDNVLPEPPVVEKHTVTYDSNDSTLGTPPTDSNEYDEGDTVTVLDSIVPLYRIGYSYSGKWNTKADGSGTSYSPSDEFPMSTENVKLYAQWETLHAHGTVVGYDFITEAIAGSLQIRYSLDAGENWTNVGSPISNFNPNGIDFSHASGYGFITCGQSDDGTVGKIDFCKAHSS
jgi:hypothetical protein